MKRRAAILPQYDGVTNWHELPADVREREGIRQLVVFIDEAAALMLLKDLKGLDKNDPKVAAAIAVNQAKTNFKMTLDDLAREARFVGIRLILGFQRPTRASSTAQLGQTSDDGAVEDAGQAAEAGVPPDGVPW